MDKTPTDADIASNYYNIALARSSRILESWRLQKPSSTAAKPNDESEDEETFKVAPDDAGLGSDVGFEQNDLPSAIRHSRNNSKLLERLLGKRAAEAKKRTMTQEAGKSMSAKKHAAPKPLVSRPKPSPRGQSSDEDEGGRSAAFSSRKSKIAPPRVEVERMEDEGDYSANDEDATAHDHQIAEKDTPLSNQPSKKRGSFLDELLAQKAKKSKKKKSKHSVDS